MDPATAEAVTASGTVVFHDEVVSIVVPVVGQTKTHLKFYFWNGSDWPVWTKGSFAGPIVGGSMVVNQASRIYG